MPEITSITSEALQATIRRLLPSQQGFGDDLQATNLITPIIDLTPSAEGSELPGYLQTALSLDSQTVFNQNGSGSSTIINTPGFFRVTGVAAMVSDPGSSQEITLALTDGTTTKKVWGWQCNSANTQLNQFSQEIDLNFYLNAGESLAINCDARCVAIGSARQLATTTGALVAPAGYTPQ
jgi:hypothetical protein